MIKIHFIVNPIAGASKKIISLEFLKDYFKKDKYDLTVKYSNYKKHAISLTQESILQGANIIVACGGDGTINEVASCLVNTSVILGIVPTGSGNGLASNLNIPKNPIKAIHVLRQQDVKKIDVGNINDQLFFSNTGIGFDAKVIKHYESSEKRKFSSYFKACLKVLGKLKSNDLIEIKINDETFKINPFIVFVSNSNELGYKVSLTPKASLQDGLLDVLIVSNLNIFRILLFGVLVLFKKHHIMKQAKSFKTKHLDVSLINSENFQAQIDGESHQLNVKALSISIIENSLNVIA